MEDLEVMTEQETPAEEVTAVKETVPVKEDKKKIRKKEFVGTVKSNKMIKTIVVTVDTLKLHPLYKKYVKRTKNVKAHDEKNDAKIGDRVRVIECRPLSREKRWRLVEIIERAR